MKFRSFWCPRCRNYLPCRGASSHKCMFQKTVFIGESNIKCKWYLESPEEWVEREIKTPIKEGIIPISKIKEVVKSNPPQQSRPKWMVDEIEAWQLSTGNSMWDINQRLKHIADSSQMKLLEYLIENAEVGAHRTKNMMRDMIKQLEAK